MRIAKIILMTSVFSVILINLIYAIMSHTVYIYSGWFMALWFCGMAYFTERKCMKLINQVKDITVEALLREKDELTKEI